MNSTIVTSVPIALKKMSKFNSIAPEPTIIIDFGCVGKVIA
jgi:hypothetical protein